MKIYLIPLKIKPQEKISLTTVITTKKDTLKSLTRYKVSLKMITLIKIYQGKRHPGFIHQLMAVIY